MEDLIEKLFKLEKSEYEMGGMETIEFATNQEELNDLQIGFKVDMEGKKLDDWFGEEYLVIGTTTLCGDPIIVKTDEKNYPVYFMFHDDWDSFDIIESGFDKFVNNIAKIDEMILNDKPKKKIEKFVNKLNKNGNSFEFYNNLEYEED